MSRRSRRTRRSTPPVGRAAVAVVLVLIVSAALHLFGLLLLACLTGAGAYWAGLRRGQRGGRTPGQLGGDLLSSAGLRSARPGPDRAGPASSARPRRISPHLPPVRGGVISVCGECAAGSCVWCSDTRCECKHPNLPKPAGRPATPVSDEPPF